ncbi:hypothetical protein Aoki45_03350 [Algoriphagus sp. oki45]|uniref:hypothetical protein n=1 Tax=Algoriphagus sp. oki45 TaxID=3067294 RepID=UPI0027F9097C|nr:hypothetical protein Aoki45_03350 [Algoriphagus sp. oki45]
MNRLLFLLFFFCLFSSCNETDPLLYCGTQNPTEDLPWLNAAIEEVENSELLEYTYLMSGRYEGQTVFFFQNCCPFCNFAIIALDCQGNSLGILGGNDGIAIENIEELTPVWIPENSVCQITS